MELKLLASLVILYFQKDSSLELSQAQKQIKCIDMNFIQHIDEAIQ